MEINKIQTVSGAPIVQGSGGAIVVGQAKSVNESSCYVSADEESTLVSVNESSGGSVTALTNDNLENEIRNTKGTTYVVVGSTFCGRCKAFAPILEQVKSNIGSSANFVKLTYNDENASGLYDTLSKEAGDTPGGHGLPLIIKCVDGKAVDFMDYSVFGAIYKEAESMTKFLSEKIVGTYSNPLSDAALESSKITSAAESEATKAEAAKAEAAKAEATKAEATKAEATKAALPKTTLRAEIPSLVDVLQAFNLSTATGTSSSGGDTATQDIKNKIETAFSISDIKSILNNSSSISSELKSKLNDLVGELDEKADLSETKSKLLNLL